VRTAGRHGPGSGLRTRFRPGSTNLEVWVRPISTGNIRIQVQSGSTNNVWMQFVSNVSKHYTEYLFGYFTPEKNLFVFARNP
jgi:hypothetical protein